ncbi:MAG: hypothetical protein Tsb004_01050 [Allomuricauda sp.]
MKTYIVYLVIGLVAINSLSAQVKIGDNPQNLNPASLLELQSSNRVLVITRVTDAQMSGISPLPGAVVYNTDQGCLHYYNGTEWINICEELDNSFTVSTRADSLQQVNPNARDNTIAILESINLDGSTNYNFEVNRITGANIVDTSINGSTKLQNESVTNNKLAEKSVGLRNLADATNTGDLLMYNGTAWNFVNRTDLLNTQLDSIVGNEVTNATLNGSLIRNGEGETDNPYTLDVADGGINTSELADDAVTTVKIIDGAVTNAKLDKANIPLSGFAAAAANVDLGDNRIVRLADPLDALDAVNLQSLNAAILASESDDNDTDATNELQDLDLTTNILTLSNPATPGNQVNLSPYLDDTTLDEAAVDAFVANNGFLTSEVDGSTTNELQDLGLNTNILTLSNPSTPGNQVDLTPYLDDTTLDEAAVDAFVANNGFLTTEVDGSTTNELQDLGLNTNILTLSNPSTPGNQVDLTPYLDDTTLDEAAVDAFVANNGFLTTEVDGSTTNELQDLQLNTNILTLSSPATPGNQVDLTPFDETVTAGNGITVSQAGEEFAIAVTNPVIATGKVIAGALTGSNATLSGSAGSYNIQLANPPGVGDDYIVQLTLYNTTGFSRTIQVTNQAPNNFDVEIYDGSGATADSDWFFTVIRFTP